MSETTKRVLGADMIDLSIPWAERIDPTHLIAKPAPYHAARADLRTAEGGVEFETTNSPAGIGGGCTGRKSAFMTVAFVALNVASLVMLVASLGALIGFLTWAVSVLGGCLFAEFWIVRPRAARRRASGEEGV